MGCLDAMSLMRHVFFGVVLGTFNLISSAINVYFLFQEGHNKFAVISVFLLWFPGIVTSVAFLILYARGNNTILRLVWWKLFVYPLALLLFYPVVPLVLTIAYLITDNEKTLEKAVMSKYFTAFLDHGPQFVLRLVIVVLVGISQNGVYSRHDTVFILSMVSSFGSMIYTALWFNERKSSLLRWFFLAGPMYSAIFACRAFTAAVLLKTTVHDGSFAAGAFFLLLAAIIGTNLGLFRLCGQDWTRSAVFAIASTLLPAGYKNDRLYYQVPGQDILEPCENYREMELTVGVEDQLDEGAAGDHLVEASGDQPVVEEGEDQKKKSLVPMRSAKFLLLHVLINSAIMGMVSIKIFFSQNLDTGSDDALVIPQILGVIPGLLFTVGQSMLMPDICPENNSGTTSNCGKVCGGLITGGKVCLAVIFSILGFLALLPALFWTFIYKWITSADVKLSLLQELKNE